jgi:cellulose biosynthesis protein BcsQ
MTLVAIASAKGAPGVTTLTVALAALTSGAVAADLDPDGGDLALRYRAEDGVPLDPDTGLLSLAASLRRDQTGVVDATEPVEEHLQIAAGGLAVLVGVAAPDQALGLGPLWSPLARALSETGRLVFADCGRVGPSAPTMPVLLQADAVILLARAELEELAHLRERLRYLSAVLPARPGPTHLGVVLVAAERDRSAAPRTEQLLRSSGLQVPVLGTVADDRRGAGSLRGLGGRAGRSTLVRSVRSLLTPVAALAGLPVPVTTQGRRVTAEPFAADALASPPAGTSMADAALISGPAKFEPAQFERLAAVASVAASVAVANRDETAPADPLLAAAMDASGETGADEGAGANEGTGADVEAVDPAGAPVVWRTRSPYRPYEPDAGADETGGPGADGVGDDATIDGGAIDGELVDGELVDDEMVDEVGIDDVVIDGEVADRHGNGDPGIDATDPDGEFVDVDGEFEDGDGPALDRSPREPARATGNGWPRAGAGRGH